MVKVKERGVEDLFTLTFARAMASVIQLKLEGLGTFIVLGKRAEICRFSTRASRAHVVFALRVWKGFAADHLR